ALLLHLLLPPGKPVVLTAAMRPATSAQADGPANLLQAVQAVASEAGEARAGGVGVLMHGRLWPAVGLRKAHSWHIDAFDAGGLAPLAAWTPGGLWRSDQPWSAPQGALPTALLSQAALPRVELVTSHADADGAVVDALLAWTDRAPLQGLVVACTGHGTLHE